MQKFNYSSSLTIIDMVQWFTMNPVNNISTQAIEFTLIFKANSPLITLAIASIWYVYNSYNAFQMNILILDPNKFAPNLLSQKVITHYYSTGTDPFTANMGILSIFGDVAYDNNCILGITYYSMGSINIHPQGFTYFSFNGTNITNIYFPDKLTPGYVNMFEA